MHKNLEYHLRSKRFDPFTMLPLEVAMLIVNRFSFKQVV